MRRIVVALVVVCGCFSPSSTTCDDGTVCPPSLVCAPMGGGCVDPIQISSCQGKADGDACDFAGSVGRCFDGVCAGSLCGNALVDPGELCDDGNIASGDGCRSDCAKVEQCGDGIRDEGEPCDDGNMNPADGCDRVDDHCVATHWIATVVAGASDGKSIPLLGPTGMAVDPAGNAYFADQNRIRRFDAATGNTTTIAGTGAPGFSGDTGAATNAQLDGARGVAIDGLGNVYIADRNNHRIRKVDGRTGVITTIAGDGGTGTLNAPCGVAVDGQGKVYIADTLNHRIRTINASGALVTIAGTAGSPGSSGDGGAASSALLNQPNALAVDASGVLYIADSQNARIRKIAGSTISLVAGTTAGYFGDGGPATSARLNFPVGITVDKNGVVYVADTFNHLVRRIAAGTITTVAGDTSTQVGGFAGDGNAPVGAKLDAPNGIGVFNNTLYVADTNNNRIRRVDIGTKIDSVVGNDVRGYNGDRGSATSAIVFQPQGVAVSTAAVFVADTNRHRVRRIDRTTGVITTVAGTGVAGFSGDGMVGTSAQLNAPSGVAVDASGNVFIADTSNHRVRRVDATTSLITTFAGTGTPGFNGDLAATATQLFNPSGLAVSGATLYIADRQNHRVRSVSGGNVTTIAGSTSGFSGDTGMAIAAQLNAPFSVAVDGAGNVFVADTGNQRIRRIAGGVATGTITTVAGNGTAGSAGDNGAATSAQLNSPSGVTVDAGGTIYIADRGNHRIRKVVAGNITTLVGAAAGFGGDGSTAGLLNTPAGVATDAAGVLFVADSFNNMIRRVETSGRITTIAGAIDPEGMGPLVQAMAPVQQGRLADPRALLITPQLALVAGGSTGTIQAIRGGRIEVVAGRYPHASATAMLARFRPSTFGTITGIALDAGAGKIYVTETTTNAIHEITMTDVNDATSWTIGPVDAPQVVEPTGLLFDGGTLYVADTRNHVIRKIAGGVVSTVAGQPGVLGYFGDGQAATSALLYEPRAIARCGSDLFIADTGNNRVRRIDAAGMISTVLGDGEDTSSGEGAPASAFPVDAPLGLACDALGNLFVTSRQTVRIVPATDAGVVDGQGQVQTIYGRAPRIAFPDSVTRCLTGIAVVDATHVRVVDACTGLLVDLAREAL